MNAKQEEKTPLGPARMTRCQLCSLFAEVTGDPALGARIGPIFDREAKYWVPRSCAEFGAIRDREDVDAEVLCGFTAVLRVRAADPPYTVEQTTKYRVKWLSRNVARRYRRRRRGETDWPLDAEGFPMDVADPNEGGLADLKAQVMDDLLGSLDEPVRSIMRLHYYEGVSETVLAMRFRKSLSTIKRRLREGKSQMRRALQSMGYQFDEPSGHDGGQPTTPK